MMLNDDSERGEVEGADDLMSSQEADEVEPTTRPWFVLPVIVGAQFAGTSLWFATNGIMEDLHMRDDDIGWTTSAVQIGFILGTLLVALTSMADVCPPSLLFATACILGATLNALLAFYHSFTQIIVLRVLTGVMLSGIYPVGMKIAADWFDPTEIGSALGWLVGALVVGTSFPFLLERIPQSYRALLWETSALSAVGGLCMYLLIPVGPYRKAAKRLVAPGAVIRLFQTNVAFRDAALGYFSHMWELYAFYTWCPMVWKAYIAGRGALDWDENTVSFAVIATGSLGCVIGGYLSQSYGSGIVAYSSLAVSGIFCLASPLIFELPPWMMLVLYLLWGAAVITDSPQFSSLVAQSAPPELKGTALTAVTCIGFALTVGSIQLLDVPLHERYVFLLLAPGPVFGVCQTLWWRAVSRRTTTTEPDAHPQQEPTEQISACVELPKWTSSGLSAPDTETCV